MNFIFLFLAILGCVTFEIVDGSSSGPKNEYAADVFIDTKASIAKTDDDYICATLDYHTFIPEVELSTLHLDLNNRRLINAVKAFSPLKLRVGGTLQDVLIYETVGQKQACLDFVQNASQIFGFNQGCLPLSRWDQLNSFFTKTGAVVVFGLNALNGRTILPNGVTVGPWDTTNAASLIRYTVNKGYTIQGWELGNEISGDGVGAKVPAEQYANDVIALQNLVQEIYKGSKTKPIVAAPGGFFNAPKWFVEFFYKAKSLQVITHHIYTLGAGEEKNLTEKIFDTAYLDLGAQVYKDLKDMLQHTGNRAAAWVGEGGGAYHGGHHLVTNAFAMCFWWLDNLAIAASYDTKVYCRQTLIGGHYGLLNTTTFVPNPDYYGALLWHRLMGRNVLATKVNWTQKIRAYTHCSKQSEGITLLVLNFDGQKTYDVHVSTQDGLPISPFEPEKVPNNKPTITREEYHLTSPSGDLHSQTLLLNGEVLSLTSSDEIPQLKPRRVTSRDPIKIDPYSIMFVQLPEIITPACKL